MLTAKQAQAAEDRQMRMAGLQASLTQAGADEAATRDEELARLRKKESVTSAEMYNIYNPEGELVDVLDFSDTKGADFKTWTAYKAKNKGAKAEKVPSTSTAQPVYTNFTANNPYDNVVAGQQVRMTDDDRKRIEKLKNVTFSPGSTKFETFFKVNKDGSVETPIQVAEGLVPLNKANLEAKGWSMDRKQYDTAVTRLDAVAASAGEFKTKVLYRTVTGSDGKTVYERKEVAARTPTEIAAAMALVNAGGDVENGISNWSTDETGINAWYDQQKSIANLFRTREGEFTDISLDKDVVVNGVTFKAGIRSVDQNQLIAITNKFPNSVTRDFVSAKDTFLKTGFTPEGLNKLSVEDREYVQGLPRLTNAARDEKYLSKFGLTFQQFEELLPWQKEQKLGLEVPSVNYVNVVDPNDPAETIQTIDVSIPTNRQLVANLLEQGFVETKTFTVPVAEKTTGFVTQRNITVDGQQIGANTFVELNPTQVEKLSPDDIRRPLNGVPKTLLKNSGETQIVSYIGGNFYGPDGKAINLNSPAYQEALILGENNVFESAKLAQKQAVARQQRVAFDKQLYTNLYGSEALAAQTAAMQEKGLPVFEVNSNLAAEVIDIAEAIRIGTGPYAAIKTFFNKTAGFTPESWGWRDLFADEATARNWVDIANVSVRVALAASPRLAEGEQIRLGKGLMDGTTFLANPQTELAKAVALKKRLAMEFRQNLSILENSSNKTLRQKAEEQNYAIEMFNSLLGGVPINGFVDDKALKEANRRIGVAKKTILKD
tara:strand:- start:4781 stop:7099 length:2319 start_codon:yes stop_codon:yes gene_type:complete